MVCGYRPTPSGGGTEKYVYELTRGLLRRGVAVDVICEDRAFLPDEENPLAEHIVGLDPRSLHGGSLVEQFAEKSRRFAELLDPARYDVVHCHGQYGYHLALSCAARVKRPRLISGFHLTAQGPNERYARLGLGEPDEAAVDRAVALMESAMAVLSDRCIAVSQGVAQELVELYSVPPERIDVIYNWYDPSVFFPTRRQIARRLLHLETEGRYLLYVGHFNMSRGKIMLDVMRRLPPDVTLIVAHHKPDEAICAELGSRVRFTGHLTPQKMTLHYSAVDLLCFPSLYAGFGLVLIEAMACGCPPVVFDYPAMNELVTDASGYLVPDPTPSSFAAAVQMALRDGRKKALAARGRAASFVMSEQIEKVLRTYGAAGGEKTMAAVATRNPVSITFVTDMKLL